MSNTRNTTAGIAAEIAKGWQPNNYLTNMSMAYFQKPEDYVAHSIFPVCPVQLSASYYYTFSKEDLARDNVQPKPAFGKVDPAVMGQDDNTYKCHVDQIILGIDQIKNVVISRNGKDLFSFHIHPLSEEDYNSCRKKFTKFVKSKVQGGIRVPEEVNAVNYRAELIFRATTPEDQVKVWCNKALWKKLDLVTGYEAVNALLMAGEKEAVLSLIDQISGYELSEEDVAKN